MVPTAFVKACDAARNRAPPEENIFDVRVMVNGEDVLDAQIQRLIAFDVLKFKSKIERKIRALRN